MSDVNTGRGAGAETSIDRTGVAARAIDVHKIYGEGDAQVAALDGVTIDFYAGEYTAVMGPSGSGKSTLMHCMAALDTADQRARCSSATRPVASSTTRSSPGCAATRSASSSRRSTWSRR